MPNMTWQFGLNDTKDVEGPNDAGIAHFTDDRSKNLIRETIQNSLDARAGDNPVRVDFTFLDLSKPTFDGARLSQILGYAISSAHNDEGGREQFRKGKEFLDYNQEIITLCIKDSNTTGAEDVPREGGAPGKWQALTKGTGSPQKEQKDAAGSFGLGKHSAFAVTYLRTVLYSSTWIADSRVNHRFIGKAILVSHEDGEGKLRRRIGYLSGSDYEPLSDGQVPSRFRLRRPGTAIYIPGFQLGNNGRPGWQTESIGTAIENYFHAIVHGNLVLAFGDREVNPSNIGQLYTTRTYGDRASRTVNFIRVSQMGPVAKQTFDGIGEVALRVLVHEDPKSKVREIALVRDSGMLITDRANDMALRLGRIPPAWSGFTAIIECKSNPGESSFIRDSESPKHDRLSVDYIEDPARKRLARVALHEVGAWVRQQMQELAGPAETGPDDVLDEFSSFLGVPDQNREADPDKPADVVITGLKQANNPGGGAGLYAGDLGARRRNRGRTSGGNRGGGDVSGGREGGSGNTGNRGGQRRTRVGGVRVRPAGGTATHSLVVTFDNPGAALQNVELVSVGEDGAESHINTLEARSGTEPINLISGVMNELPIQDGERYRLEVRTVEPITSKTFRLVQRNQDPQ